MALFTTMMESVGTLKRPTIGRDSAMGVTQDPFRTPAATKYTILATNFPCSVATPSKSVQELYAQREQIVNASIMLYQEIGARPNDIIEVTDNTGQKHTFLVHGSNKNMMFRRLAPFSIDCQETRGPGITQNG